MIWYDCGLASHAHCFLNEMHFWDGFLAHIAKSPKCDLEFQWESSVKLVISKRTWILATSCPLWDHQLRILEDTAFLAWWPCPSQHCHFAETGGSNCTEWRSQAGHSILARVPADAEVPSRRPRPSRHCNHLTQARWFDRAERRSEDERWNFPRILANAAVLAWWLWSSWNSNNALQVRQGCPSDCFNAVLKITFQFFFIKKYRGGLLLARRTMLVLLWRKNTMNMPLISCLLNFALKWLQWQLRWRLGTDGITWDQMEFTWSWIICLAYLPPSYHPSDFPIEPRQARTSHYQWLNLTCRVCGGETWYKRIFAYIIERDCNLILQSTLSPHPVQGIFKSPEQHLLNNKPQ